MLNKLKIFIQELRAPFLTVTVIPVIIGTLIAKNEGFDFKFLDFILILFGFVFLHLGTNVIAIYFDYKNGTDNINKDFIFPFTGGSRLIQNGMLKPGEVMIEAIFLFIIGIIFFIPLIFKFKIPIFIVLIFSLISGIFYTAPPFKWAHRGLGEFLIFFCFGPLMVVSSYYIQGGLNILKPFLISIPVGLLAAAIIDINEFPDFDADNRCGKRNLIVRLGVKNARWTYLFMILISYLLILSLTYFNFLSKIAIISIFVLFLSIKAVNILFENYNLPQKLAPACGLTILSHLLVGVSIILSFIIKI